MNILLPLALALTLLLAGCATTRDEPAEDALPPQNPALEQARKDVKLVQGKRAEWRVIDHAAGDKVRNLSTLLDIAQQKQMAGEAEEATRLANLISEYAGLALDQANSQKYASPYYPQ